MKTLITVMMLGVLAVGCAGPAASRRVEPISEVATPQSKPAHVTLVNPDLRFVVIDFGATSIPGVGVTVELLRAGVPVAKVRLTEPARGRFITADILEGTPRAGDLVR